MFRLVSLIADFIHKILAYQSFFQRTLSAHFVDSLPDRREPTRACSETNSAVIRDDTNEMFFLEVFIKIKYKKKCQIVYIKMWNLSTFLNKTLFAVYYLFLLTQHNHSLSYLQ